MGSFAYLINWRKTIVEETPPPRGSELSTTENPNGPPLTGGVQLGSTLGGQADLTPGADQSQNFNDYVWFDPLALYCNNPNTTAEDCAFFCNACAGVIVPVLVDKNELQSSPPDYPQFTPVNIEALGVCQIFTQWMYSVFWSGQTGQAEKQPGPPNPPPGDGPGVGG